jgi:hypothetical protein
MQQYSRCSTHHRQAVTGLSVWESFGTELQPIARQQEKIIKILFM